MRGMSAGGFQVFWSLSDHANAARLNTQLSGVGLPTVGSRAPQASLKVAMEARAGKDETVRPLKDTVGYDLVREIAGTKQNYYQVVCSVYDDPNSQYGIKDNPFCWMSGNYHYLTTLQAAYQTARGEVESGTLSTYLSHRVKEDHGIRLRDSGGVYWMEDTHVGKWETLASILQTHGMKLYLVRFKADERAAEAIRDALTNEVAAEIKRIQMVINDPESSDTVKENNRAKAARILEKVKRYEEILGESLDKSRELVSSAQRGEALSMLAGG